MNFFALYIGDYQRDTNDLSWHEDRAYFRLLMAYYANEKPLDADLDRLYTIATAKRQIERAAVRFVADRFFPVGPDGLRHNKRADNEIAKARKRIANAIVNGRKGGRRTQRDTQRVSGKEPSGLAPHPHPHKGITTSDTAPTRIGSAGPVALGAVCLCGGRGGIHSDACPAFARAEGAA